MKKICEFTYSAESLCDAERDISEAFDPDFHPVIKEIPMDENNYFMRGTFTVTVTWEDE